MPAKNRIKGAAIREFLVFLQEHWGEEELASRLGTLPGEFRGQFHLQQVAFGILAGSWYDIAIAHALLEALFEAVPLAERDRLIEEGTRRMMEANLNSLYKRFFFKVFLDPSVYVKHGQKLWSQHFDGGSLTARMSAPNVLIWEMRDWPGYHPLIHKVVMASEPTVFGAMGCKNVRVSRLAAQGDVVASHRIEWDPS